MDISQRHKRNLLSCFLMATYLSPAWGQSNSFETTWRAKPVAVAPARADATDEARGRYVDSLAGLTGYTIDSAAAANVHLGVTREEADMEELPVSLSDAVVVATFASYSVHATPSRRSLYTLVAFRTKKIVKDPAKSIHVGRTIDVLLLGGTGILANGQTISLGASPTELIPGHRYLLFLSFDKGGNFYQIAKSWDFSSGKAAPNSIRDRLRSKSEMSAVADKNETDVLKMLEARK